MSTKKKSPTTNKKTKKVSKNRLLCVTLPESLMTSTKAYQRKSGFTSMSELLRATIEHASSVALKKNETEAKMQISFRLSDALYTSLYRAANQSGRSIARIIRTLLESAPKLGIRPAGMPAPKKRTAVATTKAPAKTVEKKKAVPAKKVSPKKSAPAKKTAPAKKAASSKKKAAKKKN